MNVTADNLSIYDFLDFNFKQLDYKSCSQDVLKNV